MTTRPAGLGVLALIADRHGPSLWRVLQPITALERAGYPCGWDYARGFGAELSAHVRAVVLPRISWPIEHRPLARAWFSVLRARGVVTIYEADDDLFSTAMTMRAISADVADGKTFARLEAERHATVWAMRQCDGVTVSTARLADVVRGFTDRPVVVVPNAIDVSWFRGVLGATTRQDRAMTIGWAGGRRDEDDLAPVAAAWAVIAERHPAVRFIVAGHRSPSLVGTVPADRLVYRPWVPIERYPAQLAGFDVGCAAVSDNDFNAAKSNIKAQEYAIAGAAVVATPLVYGDLVEHGRTGLLATTADEWIAALDRLVSRPAERAIFAGRLGKHVERRCSLRENLLRWPAAWSAIAESARSRCGRVVVA